MPSRKAHDCDEQEDCGLAAAVVAEVKLDEEVSCAEPLLLLGEACVQHCLV